MPSFSLLTPTSLSEVLTAKSVGDEVMLLAGGQSLLILIRQGLANPDSLISLERVDELQGISVRGGQLDVAGMSTYSTIQGSPDVARMAPLLKVAAGSVGSVHIRQRGTIGGSLCHADPAGDVPVALLASDAVLVVASAAAGERQIPASDFFVGLFQTALGDTEVLTRVVVPDQPRSATHGYRRHSFREGEYPQCLAACRIEWGTDDTCVDARVAVGGAGPTPRRLGALEAELAGKALTVGEIRDAVDLGEGEIEPMADVRGSTDWKRRVVKHVLRQALSQAAARERP